MLEGIIEDYFFFVGSSRYLHTHMGVDGPLADSVVWTVGITTVVVGHLGFEDFLL